jgi:streptogramin lyase
MREKRGARRLCVPSEGAVAAAVRRAAGLLVALAILIPAFPAHAATPTVTEFDTPDNGQIWGITAASDGRLWFADQGNNTAGSINPFNQIVSEVSPNITNSMVGMANGPDGNVYFGVTNPFNSIGGIIPATGANRSTYLGAGNQAWPFVPVTGPEGNIWTTEPRDPALTTGNDKVSISTPRVDTTKTAPDGGPIVFGEPSLTGNADPQGIAAGPTDTSNNPSEALWVAEFSAHKIARLQPVFFGSSEGAIVKEYGGLSTTAQPEGIALGPDGNIWFTEYNLGKVGRLIPPSTLDGAPTIDEFSLPGGAGTQPWGIAAGPDGNLWIAESGTAKIARMTTSGAVTGEFPTTNASPEYITAGADGNLWFGEINDNTVGRITTGLDQPAFRNTSAVPIPLVGAPSTPASTNVSGLQGTITDVNVRLTGISHTFPDDMDVILQSPTGKTALIMSDVGSAVGSRATNKTSYPADGITLTLDDQAARSLSDTNPLVSGIYKPTNIIDPDEGTTEGDAPGPFSTSFPSALSTFNGESANGTWKLWVDDDNLNVKDIAGKIYGGWGLDIRTTGPPPQPATQPAPAGGAAGAVAKKCKKKGKKASTAKKCKHKK